MAENTWVLGDIIIYHLGDYITVFFAGFVGDIQLPWELIRLSFLGVIGHPYFGAEQKPFIFHGHLGSKGTWGIQPLYL